MEQMGKKEEGDKSTEQNTTPKVTNADIDKPLKFNKFVLIGLIIFSFVYLYIYKNILNDVVVTQQNCDIKETFSYFLLPILSQATELCIKPWQDAFFDGLGPSGLGDTLAGAFAPLAFIWLVGTVFMQSLQLRSQQLELRAQRQETDDTQDIMQLQTDAIVAQTDILKKQYKKTLQDEADRNFNEILKNLKFLVLNQKALKIEASLTRNHNHTESDIEYYDLEYNEILFIQHFFVFDEKETEINNREFFDMLSKEIFLFFTIAIHYNDDFKKINYQSYQYGEVIFTLELLLKLYNSIGKTLKIEADSFKLDNLLEDVTTIAKKLLDFKRENKFIFE